jgi:uncharacterized protein YdeI (YjbR/CyaY-like superfamily)
VDPRFFESRVQWRSWLEENCDQAREIWVGFYKKSSGLPSVTWPEAVDEALCFGWIDGIRKSIDEVSYTNRFTPRKARSTWSAINIKRVAELHSLGLMRPAGLKAFEERDEARSGTYSYEQRAAAKLDDREVEQFRDNATAWEFWSAQPPSYRRAAVWWVVSAKRAETRSRRLAKLIEDSESSRTISPLTRNR